MEEDQKGEWGDVMFIPPGALAADADADAAEQQQAGGKQQQQRQQQQQQKAAAGKK